MEAPGIMPIDIGQHMTETLGLTAAQEGVYLRLLFHCWHWNGAIPDDDTRLARVARLRIDAWRRSYRPVMERLFTVSDGEWSHDRISNGLERAKRREALN